MISERQAYLIENLVEFGRTDAERLNDIEDWFARIISTHKFPIASCLFLGPGAAPLPPVSVPGKQ